VARYLHACTPHLHLHASSCMPALAPAPAPTCSHRHLVDAPLSPGSSSTSRATTTAFRVRQVDYDEEAGVGRAEAQQGAAGKER